MAFLTTLRQEKQVVFAKKMLLLMILLVLLALITWPVRSAIYARQALSGQISGLVTAGTWNTHNVDLVYTVAFSRPQQPDGPLVVYRVPGADLHAVTPVIAVPRTPLPQTVLFFPSPDGRYLALLNPLSMDYAANLNGASLGILSTDGSSLARTGEDCKSCANDGRPQGWPLRLLVSRGVAAADQVVWSADSRALYYHTGTVGSSPIAPHRLHARRQVQMTGYDEIHRVDFEGHDVMLLRLTEDGGSLRLVGLDRSGALVMTLARPHQPVQLLRLDTSDCMKAIPHTYMKQGALNCIPTVVTTLPPDILPGNVLRVGSDGTSVECERVLNWQPLRYVLIRIGFADRAITRVGPLFDSSRFGHALSALARSADGSVLVMSQVLSLRTDLAAQGIAHVPVQEALWLADTRTGAVQKLILPFGARIVQVFWTRHVPAAQLHALPQDTLASLLAFHRRQNGGPAKNASVFQQDEWMLEAHTNRLFDGPPLPNMCYASCPQGFTGAPHVSAAILHGVAYTESNWHQFNTSDYQVNGEPIGSPVESWDGGWGEYQQTWGMPPQCTKSNNCRSDVFRIQHDQSYNIGVGVQSLINAWNNTAGVASPSDPNDPYKANHWFFAVWAYNGAYGNNPNDVPSSQYGQWYPGAPFRSIYEEYVWYFAAHPQFFSNGWTDNYLPSLGPALLPPQADFTNTSDSFVACVTCTIPDWTPGTYDRDWVGVGAPDSQVAGYFTAAFAQSGGEDVVGLPRDNGGGAPVHRWGNGWVQDLGGGSDRPGALMLADGTTTPFWVHGGVWTQYLMVDHGTGGCHGYPTSALSPFNPGFGTDTYLRQVFQKGYILWDVTTNMVAADVCS